jgi:hypothetical protein
MSEYHDGYGSPASTGGPLPGHPLADRPTEVVHDSRYETVVGGAPVATPRPRVEQHAGGHPTWERADERRAVPDRNADRFNDGTTTHPEYRDLPVVVRRADTLAGLVLLLAGIAGGVSLLVVWVNGGATGLDLVRDGMEDLSSVPQRLVDRDTWEPLAVVLGGAALFVLGLLAFVPAKTHRFLGALALLVTLVVAAGVLVPLADAHWDLQAWAVGGWFTAVVGGLGFLGALKALMTHPSTSRS